VREVLDIYRRVVPGADDVLKQAKDQAETEGFVTTILGRRTRFKDGNRSHKAVNAIIQGTAADIMKQKLVEVHAARKDTGFLLRFTVHDEVDGDVPNIEAAKKVEDILNFQSFPLRIPILWDVATGRNWKECA
jgi:DNA polymerase-1